MNARRNKMDPQYDPTNLTHDEYDCHEWYKEIFDDSMFKGDEKELYDLSQLEDDEEVKEEK